MNTLRRRLALALEIDGETHQRILTWLLERLVQAGLIQGKTIGVDSTTLEANAAMKSIVRRDTGESDMAYLQRLAEADGIDAPDAAALLPLDRKDGRTALAYKPENAVDMETGAIVAVTTHGGAAADTVTVQETVVEAAIRSGRLDRRKDIRRRVSSAS